MKRLLLIFSIFSFSFAQAQQVYWASKVLKFSSQFGDKAFSAQQVLGAPNALPQFGKSMVAWTPGIQSNKASITVEFDRAIPVQQIAIGENLLSGSVQSIYLYDERGKEYQVYSNPHPTPIYPDNARIANYYIPLTAYRVNKLRLDLDFSNFRNIPQIDCIGISSDKQKIEAKINTIAYNSEIPRPENLGPGVNSPYHDMLPIISPDGRTLYFARKKSPENMGVEKKDDIYVSHRQPNGSWSKAYNIGTPLNTDEHNFVCAISPDGNTMYLANKYDYRTEAQGVAVSQKQKNGAWSKPKPLSITNMYNKSRFACYHLSLDEKVLVMAIERDDTQGDMDLYVSFRYADGNWSEPMNMGTDLNTAGAEASVFIAADGKTLYFSSNGHSGYGDFDMFMSKRLDNTWKHWSTPVNLGSNINTPGMDIYYTIPASGEYAYYSSERGGYGYSDIYRILLPRELRPDAVKLDQGLYVSTDYELPQLKPYQTPEPSELDQRIEDLKRQLNQSSSPTQATANSQQELKYISKKEEQLNEDFKNLEQQYQAMPDYPSNNSNAIEYPNYNYTSPTYSTLNTPQYDRSYDEKINDLKRQLEKVKLEQSSTPTGLSPTSDNLDIKEYKDKLAAYQTQNQAQNPDKNQISTSASNSTISMDRNLSPYEEKLKKLQEAQKSTPTEKPQPIRISDNGHQEQNNQILQEKETTADLPDEVQKNVEKPVANTDIYSGKDLNPYEEKLKKLQAENQQKSSNTSSSSSTIEPAKEERSEPIFIPELPSTSRPDDRTTAVNTQDIDNFESQKRMLEDSIQALQDLQRELAQNNRSQQQNTDSLQNEQKQLLSEKEKMAMALAQMQMEKDQLAIEKEKLETERKKLDALKNQQYKDIHSLKRELDSLEALKANMQIPVSTTDNEDNIENDLNNLRKVVGEKIALKNVYFVVNASFIQSKSYPDLDKLAIYLIKNKDVYIEIGGHTNGLCDDSFCNELSNKRAKSVMDYLITKGVPAERLTYRGYGKTQNISDNSTENGRKLNQRVEIKITQLK